MPRSIDSEQNTSAHSELNDRRSHKRFQVDRPGKIFRRANQQFVPAASRDLSFGGALIEVETDRPFAAGEILDVGIAMDKRGVLSTAAMIGGIVVRSHALGEHRQLVAVRYLHREPVAQAA